MDFKMEHGAIIFPFLMALLLNQLRNTFFLSKKWVQLSSCLFNRFILVSGRSSGCRAVHRPTHNRREGKEAQVPTIYPVHRLRQSAQRITE